VQIGFRVVISEGLTLHLLLRRGFQYLIKFPRAAAYLLIVVAGTVPQSHAGLAVYSTGFEPSEGFSVGDLTVAGQNGWSDVSGAAPSRIVGATRFAGLQSLEVAADGRVYRDIPSPASLLYVDGWYRAPTSDSYPTLANLPELSVYFLFHETDGLVGLDGDGGGGGNFLTGSIPVPQDFIRLTICVDFSAQTWDLYVDEQLAFNDLGFKDNTVTQLSGFQVDSSMDNPGYLDDFTVTQDPPPFIPPDPTATDTATITPTNSPTATVTETPTNTHTPTPSDTLLPTPTSTQTVTSTDTATSTPTLTRTTTLTWTPTLTNTPSASRTPTETVTSTPTPTPSGSQTSTMEPTDTPSPTMTPVSPGTPEFFFSFAYEWRNDVDMDNGQFNVPNGGDGDSSIGPEDLLRWMVQ